MSGEERPGNEAYFEDREDLLEVKWYINYANRKEVKFHGKRHLKQVKEAYPAYVDNYGKKKRSDYEQFLVYINFK